MDYSTKNSCQFKIPVFYPTMEEFKNFPNYIDYIESQGAHKVGLAKVVPPKEWIPRKGGYDDVDLTIPAPIRQMSSGNKGLFQQLNIQTKSMTVKEFSKLAHSPKYAPPKGDAEELERKFWKNLTFNAPIYGADISGSIYDRDQLIWNVGNLGTILDLVTSAYNTKIEGVNTAYLYFGMWKTSFCWHTEDMDLYSINYLHFGAPKFWYAVPPQNGRRFERLARGFFPNESTRCPAFLRHKMTHISPHVLRRYSIPFDTMVQKAGEFMITFPFAYHAGFNMGYNCAESTNFASRRWIDYGKNCLQCTCSEDTVRIDMDCFVKTYQPSRYELWKQGMDKSHPEDQGKKPTPSGKSSKEPEPPVRNCSFGTSLNDDNQPTNIRQVSRRHPIISLNSVDVPKDFKKALLQSRKHKLNVQHDDDDSSDDDDDVLLIKKLKDRMIPVVAHGENLPGCSKPSTRSKSPVASTPPYLSSSDDESLSDAWKQPKKCKKDFNTKKVKEKKAGSKGQWDCKGIREFLEKVLVEAPRLGHVSRLFASLPSDLNAEFEFHGKNSRLRPHCDVCSLFKNEGHVISDVPKSSRPLLSSTYIRTSFAVKEGPDESGTADDILLKCSVCNLVVHGNCYGASYHDTNNWACDRCNQANFTDPHCCLCKLRGGALKQTTCSRWVHVTCALVSCQVVLLEGDAKRLVNISSARIVSAPPDGNCSECFALGLSSEGDHLMRCRAPNCQSRLHVSCAHRSDCRLCQIRLPFGKLGVSLKCHRHASRAGASSVPAVGDRVVAKHRNHRYYRGILTSAYEQTFCSVEFEDGSFSKDTFPEDVQNFDVTLEKHPPPGTPVTVKWSDGAMYQAVFKGINRTRMFQVEFEDGSVLNLERRHVWSQAAELPKKVLSRLSEITETKDVCRASFDPPETLESRTRGANLKFIRDDNFV